MPEEATTINPKPVQKAGGNMLGPMSQRQVIAVVDHPLIYIGLVSSFYATAYGVFGGIATCGLGLPFALPLGALHGAVVASQRVQAIRVAILDEVDRAEAAAEDVEDTPAPKHHPDLRTALAQLGYRASEITSVLPHVPTDLPIEGQLRAALKALAQPPKE